jgi:hypothetical protein
MRRLFTLFGKKVNVPRVVDALEYIGVDSRDFNLENSMFARPVHHPIHGIGHIYRTMIHCALLGKMLNKPRAALLAFCGAYIHDLARSNDGVEFEHGANAAKYYFHRFDALWAKYGITDEERVYIKEAVTQHSRKETLTPSDAGYDVMAILKDADALDRYRIGDLDPRFLRYAESKVLMPNAESICSKSIYVNDDIRFTDFLMMIK